MSTRQDEIGRRSFITAAGLAAGAAILWPTGSAEAATDPADLGVVDALAMLRKRRLSATELLDACLRRIDAHEPVLKTFVTRTTELAKRQARAADRSYASGSARPLEGIPVGLKDLYYTKGILTTASSNVLSDFVPDFDATVWERLRGAGAVLTGKLNTHEFAYGTLTPPTKNPWDVTRSPAGSSGGSGSAVGGHLLPAATGTDTAGSIRLPSGACGCVGMKPTYGRVSRHGIVTLSWSLDHAGVLTRTVADSAFLLHLIAGPDPADATALSTLPGDYPLTPPRTLRGTRIGMPTSFFWDGLDPSIESVARAAVGRLTALGATAVPVAMPPSLAEVTAAATAGDPARPSSWVATLVAEASAYHRGLKQERAAGYSHDILALVEGGDALRATDYLVHQQVRAVFVRDLRRLFADHRLDAVVHPAMPMPVGPQSEKGGPLGSGTASPSAASTTLTFPWNLCGFPSMSVPVGLDQRGLPVGLLLNGPPLTEANLFRIGLALEQSSDFQSRRPPILA